MNCMSFICLFYYLFFYLFIFFMGWLESRYWFARIVGCGSFIQIMGKNDDCCVGDTGEYRDTISNGDVMITFIMILIPNYDKNNAINYR